MSTLCMSDVRLIFGIPLCKVPGLDIMVWHFTDSGVFSVAYAYRIGMEVQDLE